MSRLVLPLLFVALVGLSDSAAEQNTARWRDADAPVARALQHAGSRWILKRNDRLFRVSQGRAERITGIGNVLDICLGGESLVALTAARRESPTWVLRQWTTGGWRVVGDVDRQGDDLMAMVCSDEATTLVTSAHLVELVPDGPRRTRLSRPFDPRQRQYGVLNAVVRTETDVFVGFNQGEFGGGLMRVDRRSGAVVTLDAGQSQELCAGPLNADCDPVTALVEHPWRSGCIIAAIGLIHFDPKGRLVEVCGADIRTFYEKPYPRNGSGPDATVAFFDLATSRDDLLAVGVDGVHRIRRDGGSTVEPLPRFTAVGGIWLNDGRAGYGLVHSTAPLAASSGNARFVHD